MIMKEYSIGGTVEGMAGLIERHLQPVAQLKPVVQPA